MKRSDSYKQRSRLLDFWTLYIVCYSNEQNILETGSVAALTPGGGRHLLRWVRWGYLSHPFTWERKQIQFPKRCVLYNTGRWTVCFRQSMGRVRYLRVTLQTCSVLTYLCPELSSGWRTMSDATCWAPFQTRFQGLTNSAPLRLSSPSAGNKRNHVAIIEAF
jgi:hypothetical protein